LFWISHTETKEEFSFDQFMYELSNPVANKDVRQLCPFSVNWQQRRNCATLKRMRIDSLLDVEGK